MKIIVVIGFERKEVRYCPIKYCSEHTGNLVKAEVFIGRIVKNDEDLGGYQN